MCKKARDFGGPGIFTLKLWVVLFVITLKLACKLQLASCGSC